MEEYGFVFISDNKDNEYLIEAKHHTIGKKHLGTSWVWTPQYYWDNKAKYVLFHDNIENDFKDFLHITGRPIVELPITNKSKRNNHVFTSDETEYLKKRYEKDYEIIDKYKKYEWKK